MISIAQLVKEPLITVQNVLILTGEKLVLVVYAILMVVCRTLTMLQIRYVYSVTSGVYIVRGLRISVLRVLILILGILVSLVYVSLDIMRMINLYVQLSVISSVKLVRLMLLIACLVLCIRLEGLFVKSVK